MRLVVRGTMTVDGWPAFMSDCAWTISTGRVLPGSVPRPGLRFASQTSPRSGIRVALDRGEFGVYPHAFPPNSARHSHHPLRGRTTSGIPVHPLDRAPNVLGARDSEGFRASITGFQQAFGKLQRDRLHVTPLWPSIVHLPTADPCAPARAWPRCAPVVRAADASLTGTPRSR
jgi:hypothetical protein